MVDVVNYAGLPFLAIYFFSMFAFPWLDGGWSWSHVQAVWDRWQSLNAAALAFLASLIAFNIARFNENVQRERDFIAAKAFLPSTLSALMEYCASSARVYEALWDAGGNAPAAPLNRPELPAGYREVFSTCIRHADPEVGSYLSNILVLLQVHDARLREAVAQAAGAHGPDRHAVIVYLNRLGEIYALLGNLFTFARGEEGFHQRDLNWEDFRNAFGILELEADHFFIDDTMNLQAFTRRRLAHPSRGPDA